MIKKHFLCESIKPVVESADTRKMAIGQPGLPQRFIWLGVEYSIDKVFEQWRETSPCSHGSGERYVKKHWFRFRTTTGIEMTAYFERQARRGGSRKSRWWLHSASASTQAE